MTELKPKDIVYYARIIPSVGIYDVCELKIRTVKGDWFVGVDKRDKHAYLFYNDSLNVCVFKNRNVALRKVKDAEASGKPVSKESYYEEF